MGTYVKNLTIGLLNTKEVIIFIVNYHSENYKEYTVETKSKKLVQIFIPSPKVIDIELKDEAKYVSKVVDLITYQINSSKSVVFLVNSPFSLPLVRQLKTKFNIPIISVVHSAIWQIVFNGNKKKFLEMWNHPEKFSPRTINLFNDEKEFYELSDKIVSVTNYMKHFIKSYYGLPENKILVVRNGIDVSKIKSSTPKEKYKLKKQLGFGPEERIILFLGRLDAIKGIYYLLDSFNRVSKRNKNVRLVIIGEDTGVERISNYLSHCTNMWSRITFTGFLEHKVVEKFYKIAEIGVLPSVYDHCPYVAIEMMAHGIPLIISATDGLNEILSEDQSIYIKPLINNVGSISFDPNEIADAILLLLKNNKKCHSIIKDYHGLIEKEFALEKMANLMLSLMQNIAN